ncbi:hypothetical protein ACFV9C_41720 [Kribbella sp. NPDC059898]|uniref:hypothetical protein n=1 Tax=Kribbella sp. NPDC059898 TaxID=3346995 RepID=UPI003668BCEF
MTDERRGLSRASAGIRTHRGRSSRVLIAPIAMAALVVGLLIVLANRGGADHAAIPPAPMSPDGGSATGPAARPSPTDSVSATACSLPAGGQTVPSTAIIGASWSLVNQVAVPGADAYGPQWTDPDGLRRCFAHSPVGAVCAAYNHLASMSIQNDTTGAKTFPILRRIMVPGKDLESYILWLQTAPEDTSDTDGTVGVQLTGFKILDATGDRVTLLVAAQAGAGYASSTWTMVWLGGDWKVRPPQPGERAGEPYTAIHDLSGFVPWRGA